MQFLDEAQLKNAMSKKNSKQYTNTSFYDIKTFKDVLKLAFRCKNKKTIDIILNNWYKLLDSEVKWGKKTKMIDKKEEKLINSLHPQELIMIINIGKIVQEKHKMKPETAFVFAFGIVCAHFVFEETSMTAPISCKPLATIDSPRPFPSFLEETNGSNILDNNLLGIPIPKSIISI